MNEQDQHWSIELYNETVQGLITTAQDANEYRAQAEGRES